MNKETASLHRKAHPDSRKKMIHFTDSQGTPLFDLPDGSFLRLDFEDGESSCVFCRYLNEEQAEIDGESVSIRQFARRMEQRGILYRPMIP